MSCGIYKIENLINHKKYIGQSIDIQFRFMKHKSTKDNFHIHKAIQKYGKENFSFEIIEECQPKQLNNRECYWIEFYNSLEPNGYNMVPGGSNGAGIAKGIPVEQYSLSGDYIATYPSANQAAQILNINASNINSCCNGYRSQAGLFQWKKVGSDKKITPIKGEYNYDIIQQYDLQGQLIAEYNSLDEAAKNANITKSAISAIIKKENRTSGGFQWKYKSSDKKISKLKPKICQYDLDGILITTYNSFAQAHKITGIHLGNISECCKGRRQTAGGFKWTFE